MSIFRMDRLDLLTVQGTLKSLLQHHSSKASILRHSTFFTVQLSHPYVTTGKTIALTRWTFVGKVTSLLFNMLSRLIITFLPRSKRLLILWLQSPSAVQTRITHFACPFIHLLMEILFPPPHFLIIMNNAPKNILAKVFVWTYCFFFSLCIPLRS